MATKPETESSKEWTAAYLQNFTATYLNKLAVFNNLDLSTLDTKAKVVEALSALPKIHEPEKFLSQEPTGEILKLITTINQNHSEQMERLLQAIDNKSEEDESKFKIKGLSRLSSDDDVHCYLDTFERLAKLHKKDPFYWTCILEPLLTGKAQQAFYLLPDSDKRNFTLVKNAILRAYSLTSEHYRIKFKKGKKKPTETFEEFAGNLESNFRRWTDPPEYMLNDEKSWQVIEKVLMDQFLSTIVNENMKHHLKDQCYQSLSELSRAADNYVAVRKESSRNAIVSRNENWEPVKKFSVVVSDNVPKDFRNEDRKQDCSTFAYNKPKQESTPRTQKFSFSCF